MCHEREDWRGNAVSPAMESELDLKHGGSGGALWDISSRGCKTCM